MNKGMQKPEEEKKINAMDDAFAGMDDYEKQRAETILLQMRKEAEERYCKFCNEQITHLDEQNGNATMI